MILAHGIVGYTAWKVSVFAVFLVQMRENTDQKNSEHGHFSRSVISKTEREK